MTDVTAVDETVEAPAARESAITRKFREQSDANLLDYLKSLATETAIKVSVIRELPKTWEGKTIEGTLDSFEDPISEEEIREMYGGGKFKLVIYTPGPKGSWQYATARKIKIAGDPKLTGAFKSSEDDSRNGREDPSVVRDAMRMTADMAARAEDRADREREMRNQNQGPDASTRMMMEEMRELRSSMAAKDDRLFELATSKPETASDTYLGKMLEGESARMSGLRQQVESELRMKNEAHASEIKLLNDRLDRMLERSEDSNKREISSLERAHDNALTLLHSSYKGQIAGYEREIAFIGRQLDTESKVASDLRLKKDKSPIDTLTELVAVKEAMDSFTGKDDKEEGGALERIVGNVLGSPIMEGIASRVAGGPAAVGADMPHEAEAEAEIPVNRPVQMPDGRIIVRKPDGTILQLRKKEAPPPDPTGGEVQISDGDIETAMNFMQSALSNDADPGTFGRTARNLMPSLTSGPIQELLKTQGVDAFLSRVAKLNPNSALLSQHGKNWTRKVAAVLLES